MEYVVIRPPIKSVTHPETILAHYVLRYFGKTGAPHPNAKIIAGMIKDKLEEHGYDFG